MDFFKVKEKPLKKGLIEIYADFIISPSNDLMIRGKSFYAIWDEELGLWSRNEYDVAKLVDEELYSYYDECVKRNDGNMYTVKSLKNYSSGAWDMFKKLLTKLADNFHQLDEKIIFANTEVKKRDYASKRLPYNMAEGKHDAYDQLMSVLYSNEERQKLEWAIGAIIAGDAKHIQKFIVLYGSAGTGKSTVLNIIQKLFEGYYTIFDAKELTNGNQYVTGGIFSGDPLVAIQQDGDLSGIKDNSKLNSIIAHEDIQVNEKFKPQYSAKCNAFLFMGTNKPVKITDAKSGLIRRLIDVQPTGNKIPVRKYDTLFSQIDFELGAIAHHCYEVYKEMGKNYYNAYRPMDMMYKTDHFFNFVQENYENFKSQEYVSLKAAYALYKAYCEDSGTETLLRKYSFREELKNYFEDYKEDMKDSSGKHVTNVFIGFQTSMFQREQEPKEKEPAPISLVLDSTDSNFDTLCGDCLAQYANDYETPAKKWEKVKTKLSDLDTSKLHYVKVPENHIVVDFDLKDEKGEKSYEKNLEAASKFPSTYAETSKSGSGIHLHYIYDGNPNDLSSLYSEGIEIKVFSGNSSLRRKLSRCNNLPIEHISNGLPLKGDKKVVNFESVKNEKALRTIIKKNLNKEYHSATKPSIDFIYDTLEKAYESGMKYDVSDMRNAVLAFGMHSTHQADYCIKLVNKMKFKSEEPSENTEGYDNDKIVFYDVEVFPNLFVICWKIEGEDHQVATMINPSPADVEDLMKFKLVGFNCRKYDNHIIYARMMGYTNEQLYRLSQRIINEKTGFFGEAYNLSYTDIYDFSSAGNKKSLKKWEIELGIHHQENNYPWDEPVPEDKWIEIGEYCANDVMATEAVFHHLSGDWTARQILAKWAGMTCNDTTNNLSTRIIFGSNKFPQDEFNYRNMAEPVRPSSDLFTHFREDKVFRVFDEKGQPTYQVYEKGMDLPEGYSIMPFFPGYEFDKFKRHSSYKDVETVGEGGYVYSEPGMYGYSKTFDVASQHPSSVIEEELFGPEYTKNFENIKEGRIAIKHGDFDLAKEILPEEVHEYLNDASMAKDLANALKTVINSVYGLTSAGFDNAFRDKRNDDNIVAKRGALFMINLRLEVQARGFTVIHCKTDSIKVANPTPEIEEFIMKYGKEYGYNFEVEHVFERICLVNKSTYIAKLSEDDPEEPGVWTATGDQFKVPYVFKTLFSGEELKFEDMCETKSVQSALYLDMNEDLPENEHNYIFVGKVGQFCPIKPGCEGGVLYRFAGTDENGNAKYAAAEGTKGWRWKESEIVRTLGLENQIDLNYWRSLVDGAIETINEFGDVEKFRSPEPYELPDFEKDIEEPLPWNETDNGKDPSKDFMNPPA